MPFTPFHFGVGLLGKGVAPARLSLTAFILSQVLIDIETAYFLFVAHESPLHRWAHTFLASAAIGLGVGVITWWAAALVRRCGLRLHMGSEAGLLPALAGGALGGITHPLLDGVMHADIRPFMPFAAENPLLGLIGLTQLHLLCVLAAFAGLILLVVRSGGAASVHDDKKGESVGSG